MLDTRNQWFVNRMKEMIAQEEQEGYEHDNFNSLLSVLGMAQNESSQIIGAYLSADKARCFADIGHRLNDLVEDVNELLCERDGKIDDLYHPSNRHLRLSAEKRLGVWNGAITRYSLDRERARESDCRL